MTIDVSQAVMLADVFVGGQATTKGSMESKGRGVMVDKPATYRRMALVQERLEADMKIRTLTVGPGWYPYGARVGVRMCTWMRYDAKTGDPRAWLLGDKSGDVDKQVRLVLDTFKKAGLIVDDGQVVSLEAHKRLALPGMMTGQQIQVWAIGEDAPW